MSRILIVDDSTTMRRIIKTHLKAIGFDAFEEAENGVAALEKLAVSPVDLVITDWQMSEMNGLGLLRAIRASDHAKLPVLMVTGIGVEEAIIEAVNAGVNGYVVKPFDSSTLQEKVQQILGDAPVIA